VRIIDGSMERQYDDILIMLTPSEAKELIDKFGQLDPSQGDHIHVSDFDFTREIIIAIYTPDNLHFFNKKVQDLISSQ